jgi:sortase (surface protein transpeptidase)
MAEIVAETEKNTVVLMTCYGESLGGQDYSHRLIITAEEV